MSNKRRIYLYVFVLLFLMACQRNQSDYCIPLFSTEKVLTVKILNDSDITRFSERIVEYDQYLIVLEKDLLTRSSLHLFDKESGEKLADFFYEGRGPGEVVSLRELWLEDNRLLLYDAMLKEIIQFNLDSLVRLGNNAITENRITPPPFTVRVFLSDTLLITLGLQHTSEHDISKDIRISLRSPNRYCTFNDYPVDKAEDKYIAYRDYPIISVSPDKTKMAVGTAYGAILELFDISEDIRLLSTHRYIQPDYIWEKGAYNGMNEKTVKCFRDAWSSNEQLYTTYEDIPAMQCLFKAPTNIAVFDWKGKALKRFRINEYGILNFCVNESESVFYAVLIDKDGFYYLAELR